MEPGSWKMVAGLTIVVLMLVFASMKVGNGASATDRRSAAAADEATEAIRWSGAVAREVAGRDARALSLANRSLQDAEVDVTVDTNTAGGDDRPGTTSVVEDAFRAAAVVSQATGAIGQRSK